MNTSINESTPTSLAQLFSQTINGTQVEAIEIPLFQRDYAQGRNTDQARHVRERFISDLCSALDGEKELHLDFVFGDVVKGTLYPLDGQQRLTTLFLLHCYLSWQLPPAPDAPQSWHAFHYATRPGARAFCQFLTRCRPDLSKPKLSKWLCDQADYLPTWKHDPTIQGMLVVLEVLHDRYRNYLPSQLLAAWQRLTDPVKPAISFLLLPVASQKLDNTLYVKMNSRGRPLTEFENSKAELESLLRQNPAISEQAVDAFSRKIDTDWADLFWEYRGNNDLIDEEFMRYLRFLFEVQAWKRGIHVDLSQSDQRALTELSEKLFSSAATDAAGNFDWVVKALDIWLQVQADGMSGAKAIKPLFSQLFTRHASTTTQPLRIFNFRDFDEGSIGVDMFHGCCALYGTGSWRLAHTLLFYGALQGCLAGTYPLPPIQLRLLRNLIEASQDEIRAGERNNMPALLGEVEKIMARGPLTNIATFNQVQVANEVAKQALLSAQPSLQEALHRLEDHELLRGGLTAFDLDPAQSSTGLENHAVQFQALFEAPFGNVTAALLAKGNEGRGHVRTSGHRFAYLGAPRQTSPWENHWRARRGEVPHSSAGALAALLDDMTMGSSLKDVIGAYLNAPSTPKDWRYYMVKYEAMRAGDSGCYVIAPYPGYSICMLKGDSCDNRSYHSDAYLLAAVTVAQISQTQIANSGWPRCFPGYETESRSLELRNSGIKIRCAAEGWQFDGVPENGMEREKFDRVVGLRPKYDAIRKLYIVPQEGGVDIEDRVAIGGQLIRDLVSTGL